MSLFRPREYEYDVCMEAGDYDRAREIAQTNVTNLEQALDTWINKLGEAELKLTLNKQEVTNGGNDQSV